MARSNNRRSTEIVPRAAFEAELHKLLVANPYDPSVHNSAINPYTKTAIRNEQDYKEYIREYAFHFLCEQALRSQYEAELEDKTSRIRQANEYTIHELEHKHRVKLDQTKRLPFCAQLLSSLSS